MQDPPLLSVFAVHCIASASECRDAFQPGMSHAILLDVDRIREVEPPADRLPLEVVWDRILVTLPLAAHPDAVGHAGILGTKRPDGANRKDYKRFRERLLNAGTIEPLPT